MQISCQSQTKCFSRENRESAKGLNEFHLSHLQEVSEWERDETSHFLLTPFCRRSQRGRAKNAFLLMSSCRIWNRPMQFEESLFRADFFGTTTNPSQSQDRLIDRPSFSLSLKNRHGKKGRFLRFLFAKMMDSPSSL